MRQTLHYRLRQEIPDLVGVDLEEAGAAALNELGCDCHVSFAEDVEKLNLGLFDAIILGDIIEPVPARRISGRGFSFSEFPQDDKKILESLV